MPHPDRPYLTRPLAGVDQALGEGRARQPAELLDQLRERLDRLDPNHPSASRGSHDRGADLPADPVADQGATPGEQEHAQASRPDRSSPRKEGEAARSREDQARDYGAGEQPAVRQAGQPPAAAVDNAAHDLADDGQYRVIDPGHLAKGEPYRPWFADDEPGTPWFVG